MHPDIQMRRDIVDGLHQRSRLATIEQCISLACISPQRLLSDADEIAAYNRPPASPTSCSTWLRPHRAQEPDSVTGTLPHLYPSALTPRPSATSGRHEG